MKGREDALVTVAVCTPLGRERATEPEAAPLGPQEWTRLVQALVADGKSTPRDLLGLDEPAIRDRFGVRDALASRVATLLRGTGSVALALEQLENSGIWFLTRGESGYPAELKRKLGGGAPAVLFGAGERALLEAEGVAVVGSRDVDKNGESFARAFAASCAAEGLKIVSGGARGVDSIAMEAALESGGPGLAVLADSLERAIAKKANREAILDGRLLFLTPYLPKGRFTVGKAMGRNKLIYALSRYGCVVSSGEGSGGTWSGALEAMDRQLCTVFVRMGDGAPAGNQALLRRGAIPLDGTRLPAKGDVRARLEELLVSNRSTMIRDGGQQTFDF